MTRMQEKSLRRLGPGPQTPFMPQGQGVAFWISAKDWGLGPLGPSRRRPFLLRESEAQRFVEGPAP